MMPVKKDATGRRYIEVQAEVPGTVEEVWRAIATGPGISSWFVPSRVEERVGGIASADFGPGMESKSTITAWDPPRRFASENEGFGPGSPAVFDEWTVECLSGTTCVVRVVHSWFSDSDDWDSQFEQIEQGWPSFFRILRIYLTHYRGLPGASVQAMGMTAEPVPRAWSALLEGLGISGALEMQRVRSGSGAPALAGDVVRVGADKDPELLIRLDEPAGGAAHLFAMAMGPQTCVSVRVYLYGDVAAAVAAREEPRWQAWLGERFPPPAEAQAVTQEASQA
jgi:uncharacterized protein YndB with AHSA1/START domain